MGRAAVGGNWRTKHVGTLFSGVFGVYLKKNKAAVLSLVFRNTRTVLKGEHSILYFCLWCFMVL